MGVEVARILIATADGLHTLEEPFPTPVGRVPVTRLGRAVTAVTAGASRGASVSSPSSGAEGEAERNGGASVSSPSSGAEGEAERNGGVWAVLDRTEVWHAGSDGWARTGTLPGFAGTCLAATRAGVLVGTAEAHLCRVTGRGLEAVAGFDAAPGRDEWFTPWGGPPDTRTISEDADAVYVNVHVGGILRSEDAGATWSPTIGIETDVHKVLARAGRLYAACGARGLAVSSDSGATWRMITEGLHATYCRGVAVSGDALLLSASEGPGGRHSALYRGDLDGGSLERCVEGLPEWFDRNIDSAYLDAVSEGGCAAFGMAEGTAYASEDDGGSWQVVAEGLPRINGVIAVP